MKFIKFFLSILIIFAVASSVFAVESSAIYSEPVQIKALLSKNTDTAFFGIEEGKYVLVEEKSGKIISEVYPGETGFVKNVNNKLLVEIEGKSFFSATSENLYLKPSNDSEKCICRYSGTRYRGGLKFVISNSKILVVNIVPLEDYLCGVVGKEMGATAKMEALKAQAVVSRTYALNNYDPSNIYDVTTDTSTQVYEGYDGEKQRVIEAVHSTEGEVLFYKDELLQAFFHSNAGGYTANSEDVWGEYIPYLRAVPSLFDSYAEYYPVQTSSGWPGNTYHWEKTFTKEELMALIADWNNKNNNERQINIGQLLEIRPSLLSEGDRVIQLDFIGSQGIKSFFRNSIRSILGLKSTRFNLETDATCYILSGNGELDSVSYSSDLKAVIAGNKLKKIAEGYNTYKVIGASALRDIKKEFSEIKIEGYGYGHGLGMSQWGARGMAAQGYNYQDILRYYFNPGNNALVEIKRYY